MSFENPFYLLLLLVLIPVWYWRRQGKSSVRYPSIFEMQEVKRKMPINFSIIFSYGDIFFRSLVIIFLTFALARPQLGSGEFKRLSEGLDIILAVDSSGSMRALDFEIKGKRANRLSAIKYVINNFISERPEDRIGMVVFGNEAFTQSPLTLDHEVLLKFLEKVEIGIAGDATAIGHAIATATNRLKDVDAKNKIVILLTDGMNTAGKIDPLVAAKAAAALGVKIYTIGVGQKGEVPIPVDTVFGQRVVYEKLDLDEETLTEIAKETGAKFYKAYDTDSLKKVYDDIDKLEKTKLKVKEFKNYQDVYQAFLWPALIFLFLEVLFGITKFRRLP